ncbi:MAG: GatB/YqeY domain-containing protein [bacterium]
MTFFERVGEDLQRAMKAHDRIRVSTLRLLSAALKNEQIAKRTGLDDADALKILQREVKRRREAITSYQTAGSRERVEQEAAELEVLKEYLPEQLDEDAVEKIVAACIQEANAAGPQDLGSVMKIAMQRLRGQADGAMVQRVVQRLLADRT